MKTDTINFAKKSQHMGMRLKKSVIPFTVVGSLLAVGWPLSGLAVQAALLVSLGMPDATLKSYVIQSRQAAIPLVIRGLYGSYSPQEKKISEKRGKPEAHEANSNRLRQASSPFGSFRATALRLRQLMGQSAQGGVVIDPVLFRAFSVQAVPALVVYETPLACLQHGNTAIGKPSPCDRAQYDVAMGNLPLEKLLARIAQGSPSTERAAYAAQLRLFALKKEDKKEKRERNRKNTKNEKNEKNEKNRKNEEDEKNEKIGEQDHHQPLQGVP